MGGGVFLKKWIFPQRSVHYVQYQYFLFYILLIWGVRTQPIHPLHTACTASNDGTCYGLSVCLSVLFACRSHLGQLGAARLGQATRAVGVRIRLHTDVDPPRAAEAHLAAR